MIFIAKKRKYSYFCELLNKSLLFIYDTNKIKRNGSGTDYSFQRR